MPYINEIKVIAADKNASKQEKLISVLEIDKDSSKLEIIQRSQPAMKCSKRVNAQRQVRRSKGKKSLAPVLLFFSRTFSKEDFLMGS